MTYNKLSALLLLLLTASCATNKPEKWQALFNGRDLSGWDTYLGPAYDTINKNDSDTPMGLNNDPAKVFTVVKVDGENAIRISGQNFGGISTVDEFENFHLQLQFRWGSLKWPPRKANKRDSGIMYYGTGAHGADGGYWMRSQELQIEEGDCGDCWACAGAIYDATARKDSDNYIYIKPALFIPSAIQVPTDAGASNQLTEKNLPGNGILLISGVSAAQASML